jgi:putative DNA methylase
MSFIPASILFHKHEVIFLQALAPKPQTPNPKPQFPKISQSSADSLFHIPDESVDAIITDPPYYGTIQYAELSDFFYVWMKRVLDDVYPELFYSELTDKDREAVANPSRFRNMGAPSSKHAP